MKANVIPLKGVISFIAAILCVCLVYLNISVSKYQTNREVVSTANYVEVKEEVTLEDESLKETTEEVEEIEDEPKEEIIVEPVVYDGKTLQELADQLDKSLSSTITGKGYLIASYSLERGVDPYMATAIILQETGCKWGCSRLVVECNNVGGQKGSGCGSYSYFNSLDEGIMAFIDNLERNYISYGLTTPEEINPKYAADPNWSVNVNKYIEIIKAQ